MHILLALALIVPSSILAKNSTDKTLTLQEVKPSKKLSKKEQKMAKREQKKKQKEEEKKQQPEKNSGFTWATSHKTLKNMSFSELKVVKEQHAQAKDMAKVCAYLEKMLPLADDLNERRDLTLELADTYFEIGELDKAGKMYKEFSTMYPSSGNVELAAYKSILCSFYATLDDERDQTKTEDTVELASSFLERTVFTTYTKDVKDILANCRKKLFDNELKIVKDYINRHRYTSAKTRITTMRTRHAALPDIEPHLILAECTLAEHQHNTQLLAQKQNELATKFPEFHQTVVQNTQKSSFLSRF